MIHVYWLAAVIALAPTSGPGRTSTHSHHGGTGIKPAATTVTVVNGVYDGPTTPGSALDIWADPPQKPPNDNMVFDHWTGAIQYLDNPFAAHAVMTVPSVSVTVTAVFKPSPDWTPTNEVVGNNSNQAIKLWYYFPGPADTLKGLIYRFHGATLNGSTEFQYPEYLAFDQDAIAAGYAVVALDSHDRLTHTWSTNTTIASNPDMQTVQSTLESFVTRGWMNADTPIFTEGMSNGGIPATLAPWMLGVNSGNTGPLFNFVGTALYCTSGDNAIETLATTPTCFDLDMHDVFYPNGTTPTEFYDALLANGVRASIYTHPAYKFYPDRCWRIPGLAELDSVAIYNAIKAAGYLDANDYVTSDPSANVIQITAALPSQYQSYGTYVWDQMIVCYSAHAFYSDRNDVTLNFFQNTARVAGVVQLPGCVNLAQPMTIQFRPSTATPFLSNVTLDANGCFYVTDFAPDTYQLAIKGYKWLQKDANIDATMGLGAPFVVTLPPGDADNNNVIDINDFSILDATFGLAVGDPGYDDRADFTCDGVTDIDDFNLLDIYFSQAGDP